MLNVNPNRSKNFQCLTVLGDLDFFPLDSISENILYRSIKQSLEQVGIAYSKAVINHICNLNRLSEREILTNCDLFEDSMYKLFGHGAVSVINKVKVLTLRTALMEQKSDLTVTEIPAPSLTINDVLNEIRRIEALDFVRKMASYNHLALLYSKKDFLNEVLSEYFSHKDAPKALLSEDPDNHIHLDLTSSISYEELFGIIKGEVGEDAFIKMRNWIEQVRTTHKSKLPIRIAEDDATWWIRNGYTRALTSIERSLCKKMPECTSILCAFDVSKLAPYQLSTMKSIIGAHDYVILQEPSFTVYKSGKPTFRYE
jgi:hypothetical protein